MALSSRNARLNPAEREAATVLYRALSAAVAAWRGGQHDADHLREIMAEIIAAEDLARADYVSVAHPSTLEEINGDVERGLLSMAIFIGKTRLIDNMTVGYDPTA